MNISKAGQPSGLSSLGNKLLSKNDSSGLKEPEDKILTGNTGNEPSSPDKNKINLMFLETHDDKPLSSLNKNIDNSKATGTTLFTGVTGNAGNAKNNPFKGMLGGALGGVAGIGAVGAVAGIVGGAVGGAMAGAVVGAGAGLGNFKFKSETLTIEERLAKKEGEARTTITKMMESLEVNQEDGEQKIVVSKTSVSIGGVVLKKQR